ncbi:MAG TPA: hypothetical protein PKA41_10965, partial [Verrucomicrobiota bacterium]|nr:hypothetical protein [Verrucomicrobiota bacterium]
LCLATGLTLVLTAPAQNAQTEYHRATRLGNPATRFAPPLYTTDDLRSRFRDEKLRPDFAEILRQWGWTGDINDMFGAAATNEIVEAPIPVGSVMPFMSSRKNGRPICLRNVEWAGREPAPAYAFTFSSNGRNYRCVTPKACSNFFLEDLGKETKPALLIECSAPGEVIAGRPLQLCLTARNIGDGPEPAAVVSLAVPAGAVATGASDDGAIADGAVTWNIGELAPGGSRQVCATLAVRQPGAASLSGVARGARSNPVQTVCQTTVVGVPAILLEVVDIEDPVQVGEEVIYEVRVLNQGTAPITNVKLVCRLADSQQFVSGDGASLVTAEEKAVTMEAIPSLAPKTEIVWRVVARALDADDVRFKVELTGDQFQKTITENESTQQY